MSQSKKKLNKIHFIGIGGIGMSALAQMYKSFGYQVSGSDRGFGKSENQPIFQPLLNQNIKIYPQDGSYLQDGIPEKIIYSTAIEKDNPDLQNTDDAAIIHRSAALEDAIKSLNSKTSIAVAGSCGKTTVTSYLAELLFLLQKDPTFVSGGAVNRFISADQVGNFYNGKGKHLIFEADESDKSLTRYTPDYAILLNIENDHYPKDEIIKVFAEFIGKIKKGLVINHEIKEYFDHKIFNNLRVKTFSAINPQADYYINSYKADSGKFTAQINNKLNIELPSPGLHNALNAASILAMIELLKIDTTLAANSIKNLQGAWRRFNFHGTLTTGAKVFDDYAHNVQKIISCIKAAREACSNRIIAIWQPHGFSPLGFMREDLKNTLQKELQENEIFSFLPVYYAGGSTSFSPTSAEVANEYINAGNHKIKYFSTRQESETFIKENSREGDIVLIMGARDNSLSSWCKELTC